MQNGSRNVFAIDYRFRLFLGVPGAKSLEFVVENPALIENPGEGAIGKNGPEFGSLYATKYLLL
jgi:hypothetical protein